MTAHQGHKILRFGLACLPTVAVIVLIELSHHGALTLPIPFLLLMVSVGFAGYVDGCLPGTSAGLIAAGMVLHGHVIGFGPRTLTGELPYTLFGMALYTLVGFVLGHLRDDRDRHLRTVLEQQRREQEQPLLLASQLVGLGYYIWDMVENEPIVVSDQHIRNYGTTRDDFLARISDVGGDFALIHPDDRAKVDQWCRRLRAGEPVEMEYRTLGQEGVKWLRAIVQPVRDPDTGQIVKQICASMDITAQRATETHLVEAQRLDSIGRLTAGIAHDFNNLLAVILGSLQLLAEESLDDDAAELIETAIAATLRGRDLTGKLLAFGRKTPLNPELLDPNTVIHDMTSVLRRTLPATIALHSELEGHIAPLELDRVLMENALLNLVINAADAMPDGGDLTIETKNVLYADPPLDPADAGPDPRPYVMIAIKDTGTGMSETEMQRAFEPFFTTKEVGKGTGLGLALVHGFAKQSGGTVEISSAPGNGTVIRLYFPAHDKPAPPRPVPPPEANRARINGERILVVDDNPDVRRMVVRQVRGMGFDVVEASDGSTALDLLRADPTIRLLLSDVVMPGPVQGHELVDIAAAERPDLRIILMSGYDRSAAPASAALHGRVMSLSKPVQLGDLARALTEALRSPPRIPETAPCPAKTQHDA